MGGSQETILMFTVTVTIRGKEITVFNVNDPFVLLVLAVFLLGSAVPFAIAVFGGKW